MAATPAMLPFMLAAALKAGEVVAPAAVPVAVLEGRGVEVPAGVEP
jgi:hypothetical protein